MANVGNLDTKLKITVDPETGKISSVVTEMKGLKRATDDTSASIVKGIATWESLKRVVTLAADSFRDGLKEIQETEEASRRLATTARQTGVSLQSMQTAANNISADHLIEMDRAMQGIADLAAKGFQGQQLDQLATALKNVAAAAGGNTQDNFALLTRAITTLRLQGEDVARMLPTLRTNLESAGLSMANMSDKTKAAQVQQVLLKTALEQSGAAGDGVKAKLNTLTGQMEAMTNVTKDLKEAWATGLMSGFKEGIGTVGAATQTMSDMQGAVKALGEAISWLAVNGFKFLKANIEFLMTPLTTLIELFEQMPAAITGIINEFGQFQQAGAKLVETFKIGIESKWNDLTTWFKDKLQGLRDMLPHSDAKTGPLSTLTVAGEQLWITFGQGMDKTSESVIEKAKSTAQRISDIFSDLASGLSQLGSQIGGSVGGFISSLGSAAGGGAQFAAGFAEFGTNPIKGIMDMATGAIAAVKGLFSALKELFAHNWGKDTSSVLGQFGITGLSPESIKKIAEDAKKLGDAGSAAVMNLKMMEDELGVTEDTFSGFVNTVLYGFDAVEKGFLTAEQLSQSLAESFGPLADAAIEFGGAFIDQLSQVIAKMKETGVGMDTLQSYFDQLKAKIDEIRGEALTDMISQVSGLGDAFAQMMEKMKAKGQAAGGNETNWATFLSASDLTQSKNRFDEMERYFTETVAAMKAQGMSMADIFKQLGPLWDQLAQAAKDFGFETSKEFQDLSRTMELMKQFQSAFAKLDFISNIAKDEARLGVLTQKTFEDLEQNVFATFKRMADMSREQILAAAKSGKPLTDQAQDALKATLPYLIQVIGMHNQLGLAISKNDQAMIKLAQDMGLLPDDLSAVGIDPTLAALDKMLQVLVLIAEALGVDADAIAGIGDAMSGTADAWNAAINRMLPFPIPGNHDYNPDYHRLPRPGDDPFVTSGNTVRSGDTYLHIHVPPGVVRNEYELARFVGNEIDKKNRQNRQ